MHLKMSSVEMAAILSRGRWVKSSPKVHDFKLYHNVLLYTADYWSTQPLKRTNIFETVYSFQFILYVVRGSANLGLLNACKLS